MKFGKEFRTHLDETLPEWRDKFLCYKPLKKIIKHTPISSAGNNDPTHYIPHADNNGGRPTGASCSAAALVALVSSDPPSRRRDLGETSVSLVQFQDWFVRLLNGELEKFNDFYVDKEEEFVIRFQELKERIERVKENRSVDRYLSSDSKFSEEMMNIRKDFVTIHGEMVLLENYSSLNFAGLVKILKKYDKRTGGLLQLSFTQLALHQPFFTTEPLMRLVRECEANLDLLFPLEEEVTESTSDHPHDQSNAPPPPQPLPPPPLNDVESILHETSSLGEGTDIYRSTLSAMRTIQGLRMSSTCNPLSFSALFRSKDEEAAGAVTSEDLASVSALRNETADQEDDATSTAPSP